MDFETTLTLYRKAVSHIEDVEIKGKTMPYTSINGNMFSFISKEGAMGLRLSEVDREEFIKKYKVSLMVQHGAVLKEYVEVPEEVLNDEILCSKYLKKSLDYVSSLKSKSTTKK